MNARWLALTAGCVSSLVSTGSTRAASRELEPHNADPAAARTRTAMRPVANGESILANVGRAEPRPCAEMIACRPHSAVHNAAGGVCLGAAMCWLTSGNGIVARSEDERVRECWKAENAPAAVAGGQPWLMKRG